MQDRKPVILSVDDDAAALDALQKILSKFDAEIISTASGREGLAILDSQEVDVVLSDMDMPEMSGPEFLQAAAEKQPYAQRIVLSEHVDAEATQAAINDASVSHYLSKPWKDKELRAVVEEAMHVARLERENAQLTVLTQQQNTELTELNEDLEQRVAERTEQLEHTNGILKNTLEELEDAYEHMVDLVANIAAMPHPESENTQRKLRLALAIGEELGFDEVEQQNLKYAVRLHRLGWVGIEKSIADTPVQSLTDKQLKEFEKHPSYAEAVLLSVARLKIASEIVGAQYEAFNGNGFPRKSVGEGIPQSARVLAVARDYYDGLSGRLFDEQLSPAKAIEHIKAGTDTTYDPEVVATFLKVVKSIDELDTTLDELSVRTLSLLPGMRLARDLTTQEGAFLLAKGNVLTENTIGTLINLERRSDKELKVFVLNEELPEA